MILLKYVERHGIKPPKKTLRMWNRANVTPVSSTRVVISNPKSQKRYSIEYAQGGVYALIKERVAQPMKLHHKVHQLTSA